MNRFDLYELCVQAPELQARFVRGLHGGEGRSRATVLGEDFAGPAAIARAWVRLDDANSAIVTDRDAEPLAHAKRRAKEQLGTSGVRRIEWRRRDVLRPVLKTTRAEVDAIAAFNFAVCELHERGSLVAYLANCRARLKKRGVFACDLYLGASAWVTGVEKKRVRLPRELGGGSVRYEWEQVSADPMTGRVRNAIHFEMGGARAGRGSRAGKSGASLSPALSQGGRGARQTLSQRERGSMRNAFVYDWRLWSIPELRDAMRDAGFASSEVHANYGGLIDLSTGDPVPMPAADPEEIDPRSAVVYVVGRV